jgi:GNAT superfamily N-acetyltransferase
MFYRVCHDCRRGLIGKVSIMPEYQGLGLGTRAVRHAFRSAPSYAWRTTAQYATSGTFWTWMARRTGAAFTDGDGAECLHMTRDLSSP